MDTTLTKLTAKVQELLGKEIVTFALKGAGACNDAYLIETKDAGAYIVKVKKEKMEFVPQNELLVDAAVAAKLYTLNLSIPTPRVVFISHDPDMYCYEYIDGEMLREVWTKFTENEKVTICRELGSFHAELGRKVTKEDARELGVKINDSVGLHPENAADYARLIVDVGIPEYIKELAKKAMAIFEGTINSVIFQFLHNDAHHENIIIKDRKIVGYIDFGESEYGEIAKEFSRYIRDFPDHFQYIVSGYEEASGHTLSYLRLVSNSLLSGFVDIVENYKKGGEEKVRAEKSIEAYTRLLEQSSK